MFTMSLGGSSIKLETGTQVDTKTRQKPLELSDKFSNFVSFEKDRITVTINKFLDLSNIVKEHDGTILSQDVYKKLIENNLYIIVYVRGRDNSKIVKIIEGDPSKTFSEYANHRKTYIGCANNEFIWFPVFAQQININKSVYDFGINSIKNKFLENINWDFIYCLGKNKQTRIQRQIKFWKRSYESTNIPKHLNKKYPPFIKIRFAICLNIHKFKNSGQIKDLVFNESYLYDIKPSNIGDTNYVGMNRCMCLKPLWISREKYITI